MTIYPGIALAGLLLLGLQSGSWAAEDVPDGKSLGMLEEADANHDGRISFDEFKAAREKRIQENFKQIDANGDGFIDQAEAQRARELMHEIVKERMKRRQEQREKLRQDRST